MRIVEEFVRDGIPLPRIGYLSFTRSAAEVIRERMGATESDVRWFRTIHGAATKQLGLGGSIIGWADYKQFSAETGMLITPDDFDDFAEQRPLDFNITLRAYNLSLTMMLPFRDIIRDLPDHPNLTEARYTAFVEAWEAFKRRIGKFDFMDMLTKFHREGHPLPVDKMILDEAQDLSKLQWEVFEIMARDADTIHMAGDDDQAIYGFIGASEYGFLEHPCDEEYLIDQSFRVPFKIGEAADRIIRHVAHRKDKSVKWKAQPGVISRLNLDAFSMPWKKWQQDYADVMVLTRHRKGAQKFSDDLRSLGISHSLNGETMNSWPEAKIVHTIYALRDGKSVTPRAATLLLETLGKDARAFRALGRRDRVKEIPGIDIHALDWLSHFGTNRRTRARYVALLRLLKSEGYESLAKPPKIVVSTMHASKGKEADLVVIVPDCTNIVKRNISTPSEIRLAYVALTRAKREVAILVPRTDTYIQHFFGG